MNCRKVNNLLSAYIDGELCGVEHRQMHEHLSRCGACHSEYEELVNVKRLVARLRVQEPSPELPGQILANVQQDALRRSRPWLSLWLEGVRERLRESSPMPQGLALGAGLALIGLYYLTPAPTPPSGMRWSAITSGDVVPLATLPGSAPNEGGVPLPPRLARPVVPVTSMTQRRPTPTYPPVVQVGNPDALKFSALPPGTRRSVYVLQR